MPGILLDLDGVVYVGDDAVPGAADAIARLRDRGVPYLFLTNTTSRPRSAVVAKLDAGAFVRALEYASGQDAIVLGKPDPEFYRLAVRTLGTQSSGTVMVGDDIRTDVGGAQRAGLTGVLVRTGKFTAADLRSDVEPDAVLDSIADLPDWLSDRTL